MKAGLSLLLGSKISRTRNIEKYCIEILTVESRRKCLGAITLGVSVYIRLLPRHQFFTAYQKPILWWLYN